MALPITNITESSTFRAWYLATNLLIDAANFSLIGDNTEVYGVFTVKKAANTSVNLCNGVTINSSAVNVASNTTFNANVVVATGVGVVNFAPTTFIIQPVSGTLVNSAITINAALTLLGTTSANANVTINNGDLNVTGNTTLSGATTSNGMFIARQIIYNATGAVAANTLGATTYNDFDVAGLANCGILNLTPTGNTAITGIVAPTVIGTTGGRLLHIQNLSDTHYITFYAANTSSAAANRLRTSGNATLELAPGAACSLIYTKVNAQWRILQLPITPAPSFTGNVSVGGTLGVTGVATFSANVSMLPLTIDRTNSRLGINHASPTHTLTVNGASSLGNTTITGWTNALAGFQVTGTSKIAQVLESTNLTGTGAASALNFDVLTLGGVSYHTANATANWTLNVRGNSSVTLDTTLAVGQSVTLAHCVTQGATPYYPTAHTIDGSAVTPRWQNGTAPTAGNAGSVDVYSYTITKLSATPTWSVFATQTKFA